MEDQQSAAGDLTDQTRDEEPQTDAAVDTCAGKTEAIRTEPTETERAEPGNSGATDIDEREGRVGDRDVQADSETAAVAEAGEGSTPTRKRAGRLLAVAVAVAAVLFVGSAAFAGATAQPYLADRAVVATKLEVTRTAAKAITTLWTYTPENMDTLADRAATYLSGDFEAQYRKFVDAIVGPNKQAKVTNSTQVTGAAVESLHGPNAVVIVYTNTTSTSPVTKNVPALKYLSYRLFMKQDHARWLVTRMTTITTLDLTPRM